MEPIERILAFTDFSPDADRALARAARIAAERGAALELLHVVPGETIAVLQHLAPQAAVDLERALLEQVEQALEAAAAAVRATYTLRTGDVLGEIVAAAANAHLAVLGARGTNPVRDALLGTTPERLLAGHSCPALVVRRAPHEPYRNVLTAIGEPADAPALLAAATAIAPQAQLHALHAVDLPFAGRLSIAGVGEGQLRSYRRQQADHAMAAVRRVIHDLPEPVRQQVLPMVVQGNAIEALVEHERTVCADLIVMGKRSSRSLGDYLLGSTVRHVLADARCDVLVIALPANPYNDPARTLTAGPDTAATL